MNVDQVHSVSERLVFLRDIVDCLVKAMQVHVRSFEYHFRSLIDWPLFEAKAKRPNLRLYYDLFGEHPNLGVGERTIVLETGTTSEDDSSAGVVTMLATHCLLRSSAARGTIASRHATVQSASTGKKQRRPSQSDMIGTSMAPPPRLSMKPRHGHESDGGSDADIRIHPEEAATGPEPKLRGPPHQLNTDNSDEDDELDKEFGLDGGADASNKGKKGNLSAKRKTCQYKKKAKKASKTEVFAEYEDDDDADDAAAADDDDDNDNEEEEEDDEEDLVFQSEFLLGIHC